MNIQEDLPMRKQSLTSVLVLLIFCTSCVAQQSPPSSLATEKAIQTTASAQTESSIELIEITGLIEPILIDDIYRYVEDSDIIIIGTVEEALPVVRIEAVSLGLIHSDSEIYENISSYQIRIEQVIKGDIAAGGTIRVDMSGGEAEGVRESFIGLQYPNEGITYLMAIDEREITDKTDFFQYKFVGTYDGFSEIIDGKLYPQENTSIFKTGMFVEDAAAEIVSVLKTVKE